VNPSKLISLIGLILCSSKAMASPKISWDLTRLSESSIVGTSRTKQITFTSSEVLENVDVRISPELAPFLSTVPSSFQRIQAGVPQTLTLIFSVPKQTPDTTFFGTIHLKRDQATISRPLPVVLGTEEPNAITIPSTVALPSTDRIESIAGPGSVQFVADEIDIIFRENTTPEQVLHVVSAINGRFLGSIPEDNLFQIQVQSGSYGELSALIALVQYTQKSSWRSITISVQSLKRQTISVSPSLMDRS
jgi:hypothetical protein